MTRYRPNPVAAGCFERSRKQTFTINGSQRQYADVGPSPVLILATGIRQWHSLRIVATVRGVALNQPDQLKP